jgi:toxin ParE1/3/4
LKPVQFATPASEEWAAATRWYEQRRPGLGGEFHDAIVAAVALIETHPEIGALRQDALPTREFVLARFPYKIVYRVRAEDLYVVAVAHAKQQPDYWRQRS